MIRKTFTGTAVALAIALGACGSRTEPVRQSDEDVVLRMLPTLDQSHSALLVRVRYGGSDCIGRARLRRVVNGQFVTGADVYVGDTNWRRSAREMPSFGKRLGNLASLNFTEVRKQHELDTLRSRLVTVTPGDYIVAFAECQAGGYIYRLGQDKNQLFSSNPDGSQLVAGTNFVHVPAASVIDAGYLEIAKTQQGFLFIPSKGMLVSSAANAKDRQELESKFPRLYAKMKFTSVIRH